MKKYLVQIVIVLYSLSTPAQDSGLATKYRNMALEYNHDLKSAKENISASMQLIGNAKADFLPSLHGSAGYEFKGNPLELSINLPESPLSFVGSNNNYQVSAILSQPLYTGGRLSASLKKSELQHHNAINESQLLLNLISRQSDITYWNCVARKEMVGVAIESKYAVAELVKIISQRVELGYADPNDLLMAQVKLNEVEYFYYKAKSAYEISLMALNSLIGVELNKESSTDSIVAPITYINSFKPFEPDMRPEQMIAQNLISISQKDKQISASKYLPQLHFGAEGMYQSPAYDFSKTMKPNWGVYAKLSVPIYDWGKRRRENRVSENRISIANENLLAVNDDINMEISSSKLNLQQAVKQVNLTGNSLTKAFESEKSSTDKYLQGRISVMDVLQSQLYRQNAQMNYIEAKLMAQKSRSDLLKALNLYNNYYTGLN